LSKKIYALNLSFKSYEHSGKIPIHKLLWELLNMRFLIFHSLLIYYHVFGEQIENLSEMVSEYSTAFFILIWYFSEDIVIEPIINVPIAMYYSNISRPTKPRISYREINRTYRSQYNNFSLFLLFPKKTYGPSFMPSCHAQSRLSTFWKLAE